MKGINNHRAKFLLGALLTVALVLAFLVQAPVAQAQSPVTVTANVKASDGSTGIDGAAIKYRVNGTTNWYTFGTTSGGGTVAKNLDPGTYDFYATYQQSTSAVQTIDTASSTTVNFQTDQAVVQAIDSGGSPLDGVAIKYRSNGTSNWYTFGTTSGGQATKELFVGSFDYYATYQQSRSADSLNNAVPGATVVFQTSQAVVQAIDSGGNPLDGVAIKYRSSGTSNWYTFGATSGGQATKELFAGSFDYYATYQQSRSADSLNNAVPGVPFVFQTSQAVVQAKASDNSALDGVAIKYRPSGTTNWYTFGTTSGGQATKELFAGSFDYYATYQQSRSADSPNNAVPGVPVVFQTSQAVVQAQDCEGNPLDGIAIKYRSNGTSNWYTFGTTSGGQATKELFAGSFDYYATYQQSRSADDLNNALPGADYPVLFTPTKVDLQFSGSIKYRPSGTSNWYTFSSPKYLFPGDFDFLFDDQYQETLTVSGCSVEKSVLVIRLKDSTGAGVAGGKAYLGVGGWPYIGDTDANGELVYFHDGLLGNMRIQMAAPNCGGSQDSPSQDVAVNSVYGFQTVRVVIQLKDSANNLTDGGVAQAGCGGWPGIGTTGDNGLGTLYHERFPGVFKYRMSYNGTTEEQQHDVSTPFVFQTVQAVIQLKDHLGNPLDGGTVQFGIGGWPVIGTTGDGGPGQVTRELFAGTYRFRMSHNYGTEEKNQDISTLVVFQTGLVKLYFSGKIQHGVGGWPTYAGPTEMLPISHRFKFSSSGHPSIEKWFTPVAGAVFEKSIVVIEFFDHSGSGIDGATAKYYHSGWKDVPGQTGDDGSGILFAALDGQMGNLTVKLYYAGSSNQKTQHLPTDSYYTFQTELVTVQLLNSSSVGLSGGVAKYYASGWKDFGTTDANGEAKKELLPGKYSFKMTWAGYTQQQSNIDISTTNPLEFQTLNMVVHLKDSGGSALSGGGVKYYASGWKTFGTGTTDGSGNALMELLPGKYSFKMTWAGYTQQQSNIDISTTNLLEFQTIAMVVRLEQQASPNSGIPGGVVQYYASGWKPFGTTGIDGNTPSVELLPGKYSFKMTYAGATEQKANVDISATNPLVFQTVNAPMSVVLIDSPSTGLSGGVVKYYASGWKTFGTTDGSGIATGPDLLPGKYSFKMTYAGYTQQQSNVDITQPGNNPLVFQTINTVVKLIDSYGNPISGGKVKYYASGWKDFGTTDANGETKMELLPGKYSFKMTWAGYTQQQSNIDISTTNPVVFQTINMVVHLKDSGGSALSDGGVKYYASGWKTFGTGMTDGSGNASMELLPGKYSFKMTWAGYAQQKSNVNISATNPLEFQTVNMVVSLEKCDHTGLPGGVVKYYASGWKTFGTTDGSGNASLELLPGKYSFKMTWAGHTQQKSNIDISSTNSLVYQTTNVALQYPGTIKYYASGWKTFTSPMELLPYNYSFKFDSYQTKVNVSGCSMTKSVVVLALKDHLGKGLAGGTARGGYGSSYSTWHVSGSTDAKGILFDMRDGLHTTMSYEMRYNNTTAHKTQDVSVNAVFEFQTNLLTLRLETCGGTPLDGGNPRYGPGSTYTTWWFPGGTTGSSAPGETAGESFPGTYSFEMQYQGAAQAKVSVSIPDADTTLTWQTTNVTLEYSGQISFGGGTGDSRWFSKPSMELLPGTYKFHFRGAGRLDLTWSGCEYDKSIVVLKLLDSGGGGLAGGHFKYRFGWSDYTDIGTTGASGVILYAIDGLHTNTKFNVTYLGASLEKEQNIAADSFVVFQTVSVTAVLNDSGGNPISSGVSFQYRYGWGSYQPLTGPTELLPVATKVKVSYKGASVEKEQNVGTNPSFVFQTVSVTAVLNDSGGNPISSGVSLQYRYGWGVHQPFNSPIELLPVNIKVKVSYAGASVEKEQNVGTSPSFVFQTGSVVSDSGTCTHYRYGYNPYRTFTSGMELLPVATKFKFNDGTPEASHTVVAGTAIHIH